MRDVEEEHTLTRGCECVCMGCLGRDKQGTATAVSQSPRSRPTSASRTRQAGSDAGGGNPNPKLSSTTPSIKAAVALYGGAGTDVRPLSGARAGAAARGAAAAAAAGECTTFLSPEFRTGRKKNQCEFVLNCGWNETKVPRTPGVSWRALRNSWDGLLYCSRWRGESRREATPHAQCVSIGLQATPPGGDGASTHSHHSGGINID